MGEMIMEKLRERVARETSREFHVPQELAERIAAHIMPNVEVALVLARREAVRLYAGNGNSRARDWIAERYPLPKRERKVPREEPVPGTDGPLFRVNGNGLERSYDGGALWDACGVAPAGFNLMRHALDLHDNPYRTELVEVDEDNPWGEEPA